MLQFFSDTELDSLKKLQKELSVYPQQYFFKRLRPLPEFEDTCLSMLSLQWQFLKGALELFVEFFNAVLRVSYSLLSFSLSLTIDESCTLGQIALAALAKLALELGLLLLHAVRVLTLLIASFSPQAALLSLSIAAIAFSYLAFPVLGFGGVIIGAALFGWCLGCLFSDLTSCLDKDKETSRISVDLDLEEYDQMINEVSEQRTQIVEAIENICSTPIEPQLRSTNRYKLFSADIENSEKYLQIYAECEEMVSRFYELSNSYPRFSAAQGKKEPNYVKRIHQEIVEHHAKVMEAAYECFNRSIMHIIEIRH